MLRFARTAAMAAAFAVPGVVAGADDAPRSAEGAGDVAAARNEEPAPAPVTAAASEAAEGLIYSVNRTPERPFETPRAVEVITREEIRRSGARTLGELLAERTGLSIFQRNYAQGVVLIRGLVGRQIQILVDGVKINNSTWGGTGGQYLNLIDLDTVERIEVVRGVVSVFGTESLGGAVNIITRKGPPGKERFGGTFTPRFSTADGAFSAPVQIYAQGERYRLRMGGSYAHSGGLRGGGDVGRQATDYGEGGGHLRLEYYPSGEKTLSLSYQRYQQNEDPFADPDDAELSARFDPARLQLLALSYEDLADRGWFQFLKLTGHWNEQYEAGREIGTVSRVEDVTVAGQDQLGLSLEMRTYLGAHRLIYGVDATTEDIESKSWIDDPRTGLRTSRRGRHTDGASYRTGGVYLLDHASLAKWLTLSAGARYGLFSAAGSEESSVGRLDLASEDRDLTGQMSVIVHAGSSLNLIGNVIRGFRAPNIDDISSFSVRREGVEVPNPDSSSEHVLALEAGIKYSSRKLSGSAFFYRSDYDDLLIRTAGTFNGLSFIDTNGNGVQDRNEPPVLQRRNVGQARIQGVELDARYLPRPGVALSGNWSVTQGEDVTGNEPLSRIPPSVGTVTLRLFSGDGRRPWIEGVYHFGSAQKRLSRADSRDVRATSSQGFDVFHLRGGLALGRRLELMAAWENVTNEKYIYFRSDLYRPGAQLVASAQVRF